MLSRTSPRRETLLGDGLDLRLELDSVPKARPGRDARTWAPARRPSSTSSKASTLAQLGNIVIVAVGYNDPENNYETDMAQVANALVDRGVGHLIWVTLREQTDDYRKINQIIEAQAPRWPQLRVADWEAASRGKDWFNPDGLHLNAAGAVGFATLLRPYVLTACGSGVRGSRGGRAEQHPPSESRREARGGAHSHLPAGLLDGAAPDRLLLSVAAWNEGAHPRREQLTCPRTL